MRALSVAILALAIAIVCSAARGSDTSCMKPPADLNLHCCIPKTSPGPTFTDQIFTFGKATP